MSRLSKALAVPLVIVFLLACNAVTQPFQDAQNLAGTAQSIGSAIPIETLQALPSMIPAGTLEALPSLAPTFEALATNMPDLGSILDPQGTPAQEWRGIPIMPQAIAGQEFAETNTYSFKATVTIQEVQDFYNGTLTGLGWTQPFDVPIEGDAGLMIFRKDNATLTIAITSSEDSCVVVLSMA